MKRARARITSVHAGCTDCAWSREASLDAREAHLVQQNAAIHAQRWGHVVWTRIEKMYDAHYGAGTHKGVRAFKPRATE